jgi:hypothetical protein
MITFCLELWSGYPYNASIGYFAADATIDAWATGVNGSIMAKRHAQGTAGIRKFLPRQQQAYSMRVPPTS